MLTDEELPPAPRFKLSKWLLSGLMAWALFFGAIGGLAMLMMADAFFNIPHEQHPRELIENNQVEQQVVAVDQRVAALERQTKQLRAAQAEVFTEIKNDQQPDTQLAKVLIGLTQLKTAYDSDASMQPGIDTLKQSVKDAGLQKALDDLSVMIQNDFPTKEKIIADLHDVKSSGQPENNPRQNPDLSWRERAKQAMGQWVRVTPTSEIASSKTLSITERAIASGDFKMAEKYVAQLPKNPSTEIVSAQLKTRIRVQGMVQNIIGQIGGAIGKSTRGSIY